jgi:hypothetical protein
MHWPMHGSAASTLKSADRMYAQHVVQAYAWRGLSTHGPLPNEALNLSAPLRGAAG